VLQDLTAVLKERAAKEETAKTTLTAPPANDKYRKQRRNLQTIPIKEPRKLQHPSQESTTPKCGLSIKFQPGISSPT
jgi:hypothetical protein